MAPRPDILWTIDRNERKAFRLYPPSTIFVQPDLRKDSIPLTVGYDVRVLPFGDYRYSLFGKDYSWLTTAERKFSVEELHSNFETIDGPRAERAFEKLRKGTKNPIVLLDMGWRKVQPSYWTAPLCGTWDAFYRMCASKRFSVMGPITTASEGDRALAAAHLLRRMLAFALHPRKNPKDAGKLVKRIYEN